MDRDTAIRVIVSDRAKLLAYAWSFVRDDHATDDLYQELLIAAIGQHETFQDALHLLKWSRVTLRNKALHHLRRQRSKPVALAGDVLDLLEDEWNAFDCVDSAEVTEALRECVEALSPNARELVELRYSRGMRGTEIARTTGRKVQTVYVALSRAYKALNACITRRVPERSHV